MPILQMAKQGQGRQHAQAHSQEVTVFQDTRSQVLPMGPWGLLLPIYKLQAIDKRPDWPGGGTWAWNLLC